MAEYQHPYLDLSENMNYLMSYQGRIQDSRGHQNTNLPEFPPKKGWN